jgi:hypothetical protein
LCHHDDSLDQSFHSQQLQPTRENPARQALFM